MNDSPSTRVALAAIATSTSATAFYALLRVVQKLVFSEPDPALVIWSEHAGYFWRLWIAIYLGGMVGFVTYPIAGRAPERTGRVLAASIVLTTLLLFAQGLLVP